VTEDTGTDTGSDGNDGSDSSSSDHVEHEHVDHDRPDHDQGDSGPERDPLDTNSHDSTDRATGDRGGADLSDRATGGESAPEPAIDRDGNLDTPDEFNADSIGDTDETQEADTTSPTERIEAWLGLDMSFLSDAVGDLLEGVEDFANGIGDFFKNYNEMVKVNTIGADKYFHCKANCEATQRGLGGKLAAEIMSYGREVCDTPKNLAKGMSLRESLADSRSDMASNRVGQEAGANGIRCYDGCGRLRPRGL
jgi:hypothetical protein